MGTSTTSDASFKGKRGKGLKVEKVKGEKVEGGKVERVEGGKVERVEGEKVIREAVAAYDVSLDDFEWEGGVEWIYDYETGFDEGWSI